MLWLILALLTAFFRSFVDIFSKFGVHDMDEFIMAWGFRAFGFLFMIPALFFIDMPVIGNGFWFALAISAGLNTMTTLIYMKAIKASDISVSVPMRSFTPLFLIVMSPLILGEVPSRWGIVGIILIVLGSYMLNLKEMTKGFLAPFKALVRDKGPRLMLFIAFIWSITSNVDKIGLNNSSPIFWAVILNLTMAIILTPIMFWKTKKPMKQMKGHFTKIMLPMGFFAGSSLITHMLAISMALVPYVISIKRSSTLLTVVWGALIFKEGGIKQRFAGTIVMLAGVMTIALFS